LISARGDAKMTEDFKSDVKIPKTCNECFGSPDNHSPFKLPMPDCWFEKAFHLQESVRFFKDKLNYDLGVDVQRRLLEIKPHAEECLKGVVKRAENTVMMNHLKELTDRISFLQKEVEDLRNNHGEKNLRNDLSSEETDEDDGSAVEDVESDKKWIWVVEGTNVKEKKLEKHLQGLKEKYPIVADELDKTINGDSTDYIKVKRNVSGNYTVHVKIPIENLHQVKGALYIPSS